MNLRKTITLLALCLGLSSTAAALKGEEKPAEFFDRGLAVLSKGDLDGALKDFMRAAKADPENQVYRKHVALLHRVRQVRGRLDATAEKVQWDQIAQSLRAFYVQFEVYGEALALDKLRHAKLGTGATAVDLADSYLELNENSEAVKVLSVLEAPRVTPRSQLLLGIGLARTGETERAKRLASKHGRPNDMDSRLLFDAACLNALVGDPQVAAGQLISVFERTPADLLPRLKEYSKRRADLASLRGEKFAGVWKVASRVKAGCGGCTSAGSGCSSGAGACDMDKSGGGDCAEDK